MDAPERFPVFFQCVGSGQERLRLDGEQKKRLQTYFQIQRKSGGGDCGPVTEVDQNVYSVCFKELRAQQGVLKKPKHELNLSGRVVELRVREHAGTSSPSLDGSTAPAASPDALQQSPAACEEYEVKRDSHVLRYLKECPRAEKELQERLALLSCSVELYSEDDMVLVKRAAQPGAAADVTSWKREVDKVFDSYMCHYELDAHKMKALLQSSDSQTDVKVYSEVGMAIIVGECSLVKARLDDLESSCVKKKGSGLSRTQTTRRVGEAKLRLLWREIDDSLGQNLPAVKAAQGEEGKVALEGPAEEILRAVELISDKEKLVLERTICDKSPHFLAFIKKVYAGPGTLCCALGVGNQVEAEIRDTVVQFFSLSADKLDESERKFQESFSDVKYVIPNCSVVPVELRDLLTSKTSRLNQKECRAKVVFGADSTVSLFGHKGEVEELSEVVTQYVLDQANVEGEVVLPFPDLARLLPELLQLNQFNFSGVTFTPLKSSSRPTVELKGPSAKVTEVRNRLGPFLDSVTQDRVFIDLPGAARFFDSHTGRESLLQISSSHKCFIQLENQTSRLDSGMVKYNLQYGLQVTVCQGDIAKQNADAIVNAANEDLNHGGGVAAALSKAGGPQVQKESKDLVKGIGRIPTGDVVVTTGGNLKCKKLLHAVGPMNGKARGREKNLIEETVRKALNLAETMEFNSIAIPCISSGKFGVPVSVCSEAIVTAIKEFGSQAGRSLSTIVLIDKRDKVVKAMQEACERLLKASSRDVDFQAPVPGQTNDVRVEIIQGTMEGQRVDALVCPMFQHDPLSTGIGKTLNKIVGPEFCTKFHREAGGVSPTSETVVVQNLPGLGCKALIFLKLLRWDMDQNGAAVQRLRNGIKNVLANCTIRGLSSVALPLLGTGDVLQFPHKLACKVLLEEIEEFQHQQIKKMPLLIRVAVHPRDKESSKAFKSVQSVQLKAFTNEFNTDQAFIYQCVSLTAKEVSAMLGGVKLQIVHDDIVNAGTDVIVNTTDFKNMQTGVSKAILTAAGPAVSAELAKVGTLSDNMCMTSPGLLGCKEILHAAFNCDTDIIHSSCKNILKYCENKGYVSVAFPAVNTGQGNMDATAACNAMLDGIGWALKSLQINSLSLIRIVILLQPVYQAFRSELERRFGQKLRSQSGLREMGKKLLKNLQKKCWIQGTPSAQRQTLISSKPQPAAFSVTSCGRDIIGAVRNDLEGLLKQQLVERKVEVQNLLKLEDKDLDAVQSKINLTGMSAEFKQAEKNEGAGHAGPSGGRDGSKQDVFVLKGLKEDVLSVTELINNGVQKALEDDLRNREEALLALTVQWSLKDDNGEWQELSLRENYVLEEAHLKKAPSVDIETPDGTKVMVSLKNKKGFDHTTGKVFQLIRSESDTALELPSHWDPMPEDLFKRVELQPTSPEYQEVATAFLKTANYKIVKIERVQNVYLWHAYSICRYRLLSKNGQSEVGERFLYHGTSAQSCNCIERDRFDRNHAGEHGAMYGKGVYFAVNAKYSADKFSPADPSGLKRLYSARVLTGRYTVGNSTMKKPPLRGNDPFDRYDSLVDNQKQPSMFVIFHDDQAYPEYLITFK